MRHLCVTPKGFFESYDETTERGQTPQPVDHRLTAAFEQPIVSCAEGFRRELHPLAFPHCRRADRSRADTHHASDRGAQIDTNDGAGSGENRRWYNDRGDIPDRCNPEHRAAFGGVFADGRGRPLDERCGEFPNPRSLLPPTSGTRTARDCPDYALRPLHLIETTARPFLPQPRHRSRAFRSRTFAAEGSVRKVLQKPLRRMVMVCG